MNEIIENRTIIDKDVIQDKYEIKLIIDKRIEIGRIKKCNVISFSCIPYHFKN
jgi:hypothetical protein